MLKRIWHFLIGGVLILLLAACNMLPGSDSGAAVPERNTAVSPNAPTATNPPATDTAVPQDTATADIPPTEAPTALPTPTATANVPDLSITAENVYLYPVPDIFEGDAVTFQVMAYVPETINPDDVTVHVLVDYEDVISGTLSRPNLAGNAVGLFEWAWDTTGVAGEHLVHVILDRQDTIQAGDENQDNNQVSLNVTVNDAAAQPASQRNATWVTAETDCCHVHVVSGTAAYRDLPNLLTAVETAVRQSAERIQIEPERKLDVYLIDRVIGQGGYAGHAIVVSYLDRQYASQGLHEVLVHEAVHVLDRQFAPDRITFLAEGLAVWASQGHYKPEDINRRSAALVTLDRYVPLPQLINDFYPVQHEIGYLQAAGFVSFLIESYGWPQFQAFYSDVEAEDAATLAQAMDMNLQQYFGVSLVQAEADWLDYLTQLPLDQTVVVDLETSIRYYDTMRRYQRNYDPTAYFLTAWLPYPDDLREEGNPADLTRHPQDEINITLEVMFQAADTALRQGDYNKANVLLDSITRVLDNDGIFIDPLAVSYLNVVRAATAAGFEAQRVQLAGDHATVQVTDADTAVLSELTFVLNGQNWILTN